MKYELHITAMNLKSLTGGIVCRGTSELEIQRCANRCLYTNLGTGWTELEVLIAFFAKTYRVVLRFPPSPPKLASKGQLISPRSVTL